MPLGTDPNEARRRAIIDSILNAPKSTLTDKASSVFSGFMETSGMGTSGVTGAEAAGAGAAGSGAGAAPPPPTPAPMSTIPPPEMGVSVTEPNLTPAGAAPSPTTPSSMTKSSWMNPNKWNLSGGLEAAGMSPNTAKQIETYTKLMKERDPNKASRNIGRIAGIVSRFYGG